MSLTTVDGSLISSGAITLTTQVTGTLPVANGGTGVSTSTGTGAVVLGTSPTLVTPALGTPASGVLTNCTGVARAALPSGSVLQVIQTAITAGFSTTSGTAVDITGLTATITPSSASNKILVITNFFANGTSSPYPHFFLQRNGSNIFIGDANGSATRQSAGAHIGGGATNEIISVATTYLDSPSSTSAVIYKWRVYTYGSRTVYIGRDAGSADAQNVTAPGTITLMEIAG